MRKQHDCCSVNVAALVELSSEYGRVTETAEGGGIDVELILVLLERSAPTPFDVSLLRQSAWACPRGHNVDY